MVKAWSDLLATAYSGTNFCLSYFITIIKITMIKAIYDRKHLILELSVSESEQRCKQESMRMQQ